MNLSVKMEDFRGSDVFHCRVHRYYGDFGCTCYHPLFYFNHVGDLERTLRRYSNVYGSEVWESALKPVVERYSRKFALEHMVRSDIKARQTYLDFL